MAIIREILEVVDRATTPLRNIGNEMSRTSRQASSLGATMGKVGAAIASVATIKTAINMSDTLTMTEARLNNINDGLQTTAELQRMIYDSAQRSRGSYVQMSQTVAALKAQTGDTFSSVREAVVFTELLNKQFKIAGTDAGAISSVMYNLTQALSTGVLRGQDLNIVMSNAPQLAQRIAKYMGITVGQLRELASEGNVTADVVKNALLSSASDIEDQFNKMPKTFGDAMSTMKNVAVRAFMPISTEISRIVNSPQFASAMESAARVIAVSANLILRAFNAVGAAIDFLGQHMDVVQPALVGAGTAMAIYAASTGAAAVATTLLSNPLIIVGAILGIIIGKLMQVANTGHTAMGDLAGAVTGAGSVILNAIAQVGNFFLSVAEGLVNGWNNTIFTIKSAFWGFVQATVNGVNTLIDALNKIPGIDIGAVGNPVDMPDQAKTVQFGRFETTTMADAFQSGYDQGSAWGDSKQAAITSALSDMSSNMGDLMGGGSLSDLMGGLDTIAANQGLPVNVGKVGSVDKVKNVKLSDEDVKLYRDLAERRYMNNIELQTLAPNISVSIPESAARNLTANDIADKLKTLLIEQAAAHTAVAHA